MKVLTRIHYDAILSFRFVCQEIKRNEKTMRSFFTYETDCTLKDSSKKPVISGSSATLSARYLRSLNSVGSVLTNLFPKDQLKGTQVLALPV